MSDSAHAFTIKMDEKLAFDKNCMKNVNSVFALANATSRSIKVVSNKSEDDRYTLDRWKLYLDSYIAYHSFFVKEFLRARMVTRL